jgi:hypothetical protein
MRQGRTRRQGLVVEAGQVYGSLEPVWTMLVFGLCEEGYGAATAREFLGGLGELSAADASHAWKRWERLEDSLQGS